LIPVVILRVIRTPARQAFLSGSVCGAPRPKTSSALPFGHDD
jgi:hypothetical protein